MRKTTCSHKDGVYHLIAAVIAVVFLQLLYMCVSISPFNHTKWSMHSLCLSNRRIRWFHNTLLTWANLYWRFIISGKSIYLQDLEWCLKMLLAQTRKLTCLLLHHLVILLLREGQSDGVICCLCQRLWFRENNSLSNRLYGSTTLTHATVVIRGVGSSTVLWVLEPLSSYRSSPHKQ